MHCEIVTSEESLAALGPEWDALQERCGKNLFTGHAWCEGWWRHMGKAAGWQLHVVILRREGRLIGVAPLAVMRHRSVRMLEWAGGEVCDYSDFLLENPADAEALWDAVRASPHYDLARIKDVASEALCLSALEGFAKHIRTSSAHAIRIEWATFDAWLASIPYRGRKQYRHRVKQAEAIGPLRYEIVRTAPVNEKTLAALVEQKTAWAKARGLRGMFDSANAIAFLHHIIAAEARAGRMHFSVLTCGDAIIAVHLGFVADGRFLSYMPSYSAHHAELSPGKLSLFKCIGWAVENGCTEYDFMRGEEDYKNALATHTRELKELIFARTLKGKLAQLLYTLRYR